MCYYDTLQKNLDTRLWILIIFLNGMVLIKNKKIKLCSCENLLATSCVNMLHLNFFITSKYQTLLGDTSTRDSG